MNKAKAKHEKEITDLQTETQAAIHKAKNEVAELHKKSLQTTEQCQQLASENEKLKANTETAAHDWTKQVDELTRTCQELQTKNSAIVSDMEVAAEEKILLQTSHESDVTEKKKLQAECFELKLKNQNLRTKVQDVQKLTLMMNEAHLEICAKKQKIEKLTEKLSASLETQKDIRNEMEGKLVEMKEQMVSDFFCCCLFFFHLCFICDCLTVEKYLFYGHLKAEFLKILLKNTQNKSLKVS
jgi:uncharacterized phage infection (PIP) family protein YhgE